MRLRIAAIIVGIALLKLQLAAAAIAPQAEKDAKTIKNGSVVSLQYAVSSEDGKTIESNEGKDPLKYTHGSQQIIPGLEKELAGMKVGGEKRVRVKPEDGYGPVDPKRIQAFPKEDIPPNGLKVGAVLVARGPQGQPIPVTVKEIKDNTVVLDFNHPLAGKTLIFDIKVLDIESSPVDQPAQPPQAKPSEPAPAQGK